MTYVGHTCGGVCVYETLVKVNCHVGYRAYKVVKHHHENWC